MFQYFYPHDYKDSTYEINFEEYYKKGYRGVLFDIDNTLVMHGADADEKAEQLFRELKKIGFSTCLISNNKEERVKRFNKNIRTKYIFKAGKPLKKNYIKAMEMMGTNPKNSIFVGDQIFTDVCGGNLAGIRTILVKPIHPKEEIQIVLKRYLEAIVLFFYKIHVKHAKPKYSSAKKES